VAWKHITLVERETIMKGGQRGSEPAQAGVRIGFFGGLVGAVAGTENRVSHTAACVAGLGRPGAGGVGFTDHFAVGFHVSVTCPQVMVQQL
jgi:hypothetical protein